MLETWNDLSVMRDAVNANEITATLDSSPLVLNPFKTGTSGQGDEYSAVFALSDSQPFDARPAGTSTLAVTDGETTWQVEIDNLFSRDLSPTKPLAPGDNTLVWPSAKPYGAVSAIDWACVEIVGGSSTCGGADLQPSSVVISQQYITMQIAATAGDQAVVTAEREIAPQSTGPAFITKIRNRYEQTIGQTIAAAP
jgi:hypothetical protein